MIDNSFLEHVGCDVRYLFCSSKRLVIKPTYIRPNILTYDQHIVNKNNLLKCFCIKILLTFNIYTVFRYPLPRKVYFTLGNFGFTLINSS